MPHATSHATSPATLPAAPDDTRSTPSDAAGLGPSRTIWACFSRASLSPQPLTSAVAFARGSCSRQTRFQLRDTTGEPLPLQTEPLKCWPDGSLQWLRVETLCPPKPSGKHALLLEPCQPQASPLPERPDVAPALLSIASDERSWRIHTGVATFILNRSIFTPLQQVLVGKTQVLEEPQSRLLLLNAEGHPCPPMLHSSHIEAQGPLRATLHFSGHFGGLKGLRFEARATFWGGTGLYRLDLTLHNPRRAAHPGGVWDLGDSGSCHFQEASLTWTLPETPSVRLHPEPERDALSLKAFSLFQASSGGDHWKSPNHVNRHGVIPLAFKGYRLDTHAHSGQQPTFAGQRALPRVQLSTQSAILTLGLPTFWQEFPKTLACQDRALHLGLFPHEHSDLFEMQGGERKTHTLWLDVRSSAKPPQQVGLEWVDAPAVAMPDAAELAESDALPWFAACPSLPSDAAGRASSNLESFLQSAVDGPRSLIARRECIDEYGWRNFGEVYGDHEQLHYPGDDVAISHFNNQYDLLNGLILCGLRSTDPRFFVLAGPLARHVQDIDVYHTREDKAAYNGGLFWHTDHYLSAQTCSHRTFSELNAGGRMDYGGGPSAQHNATSGLLLWYLLTGDVQAKETVLELASWVSAMDDGSQNLLGILTDVPTGWATSTFDFHGPGRGAGYSLLALQDAWVLTGDVHWMQQADALIRRTVHPQDDVAAHDLLNAELRWSYTIFLSALARHLELKIQQEMLDHAYAYAQASLIRYASWMLEHEYPYFDRKETLIYPTETWAGQEIRKANVLKLAARHVEDPLRSRLLARGQALAERAWSDLQGFESRAVTRSLAIWMQEGPRSEALNVDQRWAPRPTCPPSFGEPVRFVPQRQQLKDALSHPRETAQMLLNALQPTRWRKLLGREGSVKP